MFLKSIRNTLIFVITVVPLQTLFGFLVAVWVDKRKTTWLGKFVRNGMFVPSLASLGVVAIVWRVLLNNDQSPLGYLLSFVGIESSMILGSKEMVFPALIIMDVLMGMGYYMVLYLAYLVDIPDSYYEAARLDGASDFQIMRHITAPLMKSTTIMIIFLVCIYSCTNIFWQVLLEMGLRIRRKEAYETENIQYKLQILRQTMSYTGGCR